MGLFPDRVPGRYFGMIFQTCWLAWPQLLVIALGVLKSLALLLMVYIVEPPLLCDWSYVCISSMSALRSHTQNELFRKCSHLRLCTAATVPATSSHLSLLCHTGV